MGSNFQFVFIYWLCATIPFSFGIKIQFYKNLDYTGLIYESNSDENCINFPSNELVYSITTDTCLITYLHPNCKSTRTSKTMPGNRRAITGHYLATKSFHVCNDEEGGSVLNVDITKYYEETKPAVVPAVLERYSRVCTCINIPDYIQKMDKWSINNHANEFRVYYEPNCLESKIQSTLFPAGQYADIRNIFNWTVNGRTLKRPYKINSFGPNLNSKYFQSSCQLYNLLSQLKSNVSKQEHNLGQNELKVNANQKDIKGIQFARINEALELGQKFGELKMKLIDIEKDLDDKVEKLRDEFWLNFLQQKQKLNNDQLNAIG